MSPHWGHRLVEIRGCCLEFVKMKPICSKTVYICARVIYTFYSTDMPGVVGSGKTKRRILAKLK